MNDFLFRALLALLIATCGCFGTYYWYAHTDKRIARHEEGAPIARIVTSTNEVMRRPAQRLIWKSVNRREELYDGEAVRTASSSEAQIEFLDQNVTVSLDPDSVIEISRNNGKLNLSFLEGNMIVKTADDSNVTLRSGDREFALGGAMGPGGAAELAISKARDGGGLEVQSFKGAIKEIRAGGAPPKPIEIAKFRVLRPSADEISYVSLGNDPDERKKIAIEFTPIESSYEVSIEAGDTRDELSPLAEAGTVDGKSGKILVPLKLGRTFFRLIAKAPGRPQSNMKTPITRALVRAKLPPELLQPANDVGVEPIGTRGEVRFQWSNPGKLSHLRFELSASPSMTPTIEARELGSELRHETAVGANGRVLYWRVVGRLPLSGEALSSPIFSFRTSSGKPIPLAAPKLELPADQSAIELATMRDSGMKLRWTPVAGATEYEIVLHEKSGDAREFKFSSKTPSGHVEKLKPGRYAWSVIAKDEHGQVSPASVERAFAVNGVPSLNWSDHRMSESVVFKGRRPTLRAIWEHGPGKPAAWRIRIAQDRMPASAEKDAWITVKDPRFQKPLEGAGSYQLEAESLDERGEVLARTPLRTVSFQQAPPPPAPKFARDLPAELRADERGAIEVSWLPVGDAKLYQVQVRSKDGVFTKTWQSKGTKYAFDHLPPGQYDVVLQSMDEIDRVGPEESRPLTVPEYSDVRAPKFKALKVK